MHLLRNVIGRFGDNYLAFFLKKQKNDANKNDRGDW